MAPDPAGGDGVAYPSIYVDDGNVFVGYFARMGRGEQTRGSQYVAVLPLTWFYAERDHHHPEIVADRSSPASTV